MGFVGENRGELLQFGQNHIFFKSSDIIIGLHFQGLLTACLYNALGILYEFLNEHPR